MESYKHLDNLCKDMNGIGVTGYIKDMEQEKNGDFYVAIWKEDYRKLKHYRYIRNQIAHENDVNENNLCSAGDTAWLDSFYQRILAQTDPLALYYKKQEGIPLQNPRNRNTLRQLHMVSIEKLLNR